MTRATKNLTRLPHLSPIGALEVEGRGQAARVPQTPAAAAAHLPAPSPLPTSQPCRRCPPPGPIAAAHLLVPPPLSTSGAAAAAYLLAPPPLPTSRRRRHRCPPPGAAAASPRPTSRRHHRCPSHPRTALKEPAYIGDSSVSHQIDCRPPLSAQPAAAPRRGCWDGRCITPGRSARITLPSPSLPHPWPVVVGDGRRPTTEEPHTATSRNN
jgi:hypothetical protein